MPAWGGVSKVRIGFWFANRLGSGIGFLGEGRRQKSAEFYLAV